MWQITLFGAAQREYPDLAIAFCGAGHADMVALELITSVDGMHCGECFCHIHASLRRDRLDARRSADVSAEIIV